VTYLGVSISSDLSWAAHIDSVCCKAKWQIGLLHRHFYARSPSCKAQLYKSLVLPILDYCSSLWDPNNAIHVNKLESVQKLAARFVTGRWHDNYDSLLSLLNWPELSTRRKGQKLLLCNHILKGYSILPPSLFTPIHFHTSDIIILFPCTTQLSVRLLTYPLFQLVLYHYGTFYQWTLFVPLVCILFLQLSVTVYWQHLY